MKNLNLIEHPLLLHKVGFLRDKNTKSSEFRSIIKELSRYLAYEATKDYELTTADVETPWENTTVQRIATPPIVVSIMRAGNGMLDSLLTTLPFAQAGHIGIYRDKFIKNTVEYYFKLPENCKGKPILLADPLLATGDTIIASIDRLKQYEVGEIRCLCILVSKQGLSDLYEAHPDVKVYAISVERELNEMGYLLPGLGDAGDRLYNTK
ncbi:MAG: uracil phosphoribosyltransferase [Bdellovibrionales bacterium]|nr:uracil phosphoribosyltransferase [Bdellovibrionales bacterium]